MSIETLTREVQALQSLPPVAARRALRRAAGVSLTRAGEALGVSHEAVRLWELGLRQPRGRNLLAYARLLAVFRGGP